MSDGCAASQRWAARVCMSVLAGPVILAAAQAAQAGGCEGMMRRMAEIGMRWWKRRWR